MPKALTLSRYLGLNFLREKLLLILTLAFPVILLFVATASTSNIDIPLELDGELILPMPQAKALAALAYAVTAVIFVTAIVSFFVGHQVKTLIPRLRTLQYTGTQIAGAYIILIGVIDIIAALVTGGMALIWVKPSNYWGYFLGLVIGAVIFSVIGLLLATVLESRNLGIILIVTLAVLDTAFLENPVFSRRYNDLWLDAMPAHRVVKTLLNSVFTTESVWWISALIALSYLAGLVLLFLFISWRKGLRIQISNKEKAGSQ